MGKLEIDVRGAGVYQIRCIANGKLYVGSAAHLNQREKQHKSDLRLNKHGNPRLQRAWNKYGESSFKFSVLEVVEEREKLIEREQYYIDTLNPEFNILRVAGSALGRIVSMETRQKLREITIAQFQDEGKRAIHQQATLEAMQQPDVLARLSESHKGYVPTAEQRKKLGDATRGKPRLDSVGKKASAETKAKMSVSIKRQWATRAKPIEHGTNRGYARGCRCELCTNATREYKKQYQIKNKERISRNRKIKYYMQRYGIDLSNSITVTT